MTLAIVMLAKTPGFTPAKTRLASEIGREAADEVYLECVKSLKLFLLDQSIAEPYVAVAENEAVNHKIWDGLNSFYAGDGDFAKRMWHVVHHLLKEYPQGVILIGTDTPHIDENILVQTKKYMASGKSVIGKTHDGGFYLFATSTTTDLKLWEDVAYSTDDTAIKFIESLNLEFVELPVLTDIDYKDDLEVFIKESVDNKYCRILRNNIPFWVSSRT